VYCFLQKKENTMKKTFCAALVIASVSFSNFASADLVEADWQSTGDNKAVLDTNSGLTWLDLTETHFYTRTELLNVLSGAFSGWRLPTANEVSSMIAEALPSLTATTGNFQDAFGGTPLFNEAVNFADLFNSNPVSGDVIHYGVFDATGYLGFSGAYVSEGFARAFNEFPGAGTSADLSFSHFLVLDENSTPGTGVDPGTGGATNVSTPTILGALALLGFAGMRRRKM
jgi:MYXO-CTERM domain-containing protein